MKEINVKDLRIGNWVFEPEIGDYPYFQVEQITRDEEDGRLWVHYRNGSTRTTAPEPIPLTEDWLLRFGFQKRESSTCNAWYIGTNEITHDWLFDIVWLHRPELINSPNFPFYRNGRHLIQYVHTLQNLYFSLCGKELEIIDTSPTK